MELKLFTILAVLACCWIPPGEAAGEGRQGRLPPGGKRLSIPPDVIISAVARWDAS